MAMFFDMLITPMPVRQANRRKKWDRAAVAALTRCPRILLDNVLYGIANWLRCKAIFSTPMKFVGIVEKRNYLWLSLQQELLPKRFPFRHQEVSPETPQLNRWGSHPLNYLS
jgi:hypothetical protein